MSMSQSEFQRALKKFESKKIKRAQAAVKALETPKAVSPAMPFLERQPEVVKSPKPAYVAPKLTPMVLILEGPVPMRLNIEYSGTLMGGQLTEQALKPILKKALSVLGRVS